MSASLSTIKRLDNRRRHVALGELEDVTAAVAQPTAQQIRAMREAADKFNEGKKP